MKVHIILVTKYRKQLFTYHKLNEDVKQYLYEASEKLKCNIIRMETDKDHVHILLEYKPSQRVSDIVAGLKQNSTYCAWNKYESWLKRRYWKHRILWSDGYFACSIGQVSQEIIEKYIENRRVPQYP